MKLRLRIALLVVALCLLTQAADPESDGVEKRQIKRWMSLYTEMAAAYELTVTGEDRAELHFHRTPLLKYTNPVRQRQQHGALFLWTRSGRPEVVGTLWSKLLPDSSRRRIATEFHSLSNNRVVASHHGKDIWNPREPGVHFELVPDAAPPADTSKRRLIQLRMLAREFVAEIVDDQKRQLRLMSRPLYRYDSNDLDVLDGGLFTFVMATDPELILIFEARMTDDGHRWHFAAARFTNAALQLRHNDTKVWSCPTVDPSDRTGSYYYNPRVTVRGSLIE